MLRNVTEITTYTTKKTLLTRDLLTTKYPPEFTNGLPRDLALVTFPPLFPTSLSRTLSVYFTNRRFSWVNLLFFKNNYFINHYRGPMSSGNLKLSYFNNH